MAWKRDLEFTGVGINFLRDSLSSLMVVSDTHSWRLAGHHGSPQRYPIMFLLCSVCISLHHMQAFLPLSYYSDLFVTKKKISE